jgi:membrane-bound lytic murein transglycosylase D
VEEIKTLNPQYKRNVIPAFTESFPLRLRRHDLDRFEQMQDSIFKYEYDTYFAPLQVYVNTYTGKSTSTSSTKKKYHTVRSGESLSKIANKYGLSVTELKQMNKLKSNYVKVGQKLVVGYTYVAPPQNTNTTPASDSTATASARSASPSNSGSTSANSSNNSSSSSSSSSSSEASYTTYTVKSGDTLSKIASRYGVSVKRIADYNHLTNINSLRVGQKLKIPKK